MKRIEFAYFAQLAAEVESKEEFVRKASDCPGALSSHIWEVVHCSALDIRRHAGMTQKEFSATFLLSKRTVESWEESTRTIPLHLKLLLAEATGFLKIQLE